MAIHSPITGNLIKITVEELCLQVHESAAPATKKQKRSSNWEQAKNFSLRKLLFGWSDREIPNRRFRRREKILANCLVTPVSHFFQTNYFKVISNLIVSFNVSFIESLITERRP